MAVTGKRKRPSHDGVPPSSNAPRTFQIITGSYERTLHGFTATLASPSQKDSESRTTGEPPTFQDTFLFNAHTSSIRCLALSPPSGRGIARKRILATGGADERVNLYVVSAVAPRTTSSTNEAPSLSGGLIEEDKSQSAVTGKRAFNREIGSLAHHTSTVTSLHFPVSTAASAPTNSSSSNTRTPTKGSHILLTTSTDNTLALTRMRDWSLLNTLRAPLPSHMGRPSGDTSTPADVPAGITALAVHPSARVAVSVGRGERCLRLWDLVRGKRAGVLQFDRNVLSAIGEGKHAGAVGGGNGEGRTVCWNSDGTEFAVGFERGLLVYSGEDCVVKGTVSLGVRNRLCAAQYVDIDAGKSGDNKKHFLALSTEDGRVLFYDTASLFNPVTTPASNNSEDKTVSPVPMLMPLAQLGTPTRNRRIKDFATIPTPPLNLSQSDAISEHIDELVVVTACSDGIVAIWNISGSELLAAAATHDDKPIGGKKAKTNGGDAVSDVYKKDASSTNGDAGAVPHVRNVGMLRGTYDTGRRLTCVVGILMDAANDDYIAVDETGDSESENDLSSSIGDEEGGAGENGVVIHEGEEGEDSDDDFSGFDEDE